MTHPHWSHPTLEELRLSGFLSFPVGAASWRPGPLALLFGANAAGKSNVLKGLRMLSEIAGGWRPPGGDPSLGAFPDAVRKAGGMQTLVHRGAAGTPMEILAQVRLSGSGASRYSIAIAEPIPGASFIALEKIEAQDGSVILDRRGRDAEVHDREAGIELTQPLDPMQPALQALGVQFQPALRETLRRLTHLEPQPGVIRDQRNVVLRGERVLARDGSNLAARLDTLQTRRDGVFDRIEALTREVWPGLERLLLTHTEDGRVFIEARERGLSGATPHWAFSDGVLRFLAIVASLLDPDPPPLLAIEEPENHLHPKMIELVADLAIESARRVQVILTTHHATLITRIGEEAGLEALHHVRVDGTGTVIEPVATNSRLRETVQESGLGVGRVWASGAFTGGR